MAALLSTEVSLVSPRWTHGHHQNRRKWAKAQGGTQGQQARPSASGAGLSATGPCMVTML